MIYACLNEYFTLWGYAVLTSISGEVSLLNERIKVYNENCPKK